MKAVLVLRLRTLAVPGDDGQDRGKRTTHARRGFETTGKLSYDCSVAIQKLPTIRFDPHLQQIARG